MLKSTHFPTLKPHPPITMRGSRDMLISLAMLHACLRRWEYISWIVLREYFTEVFRGSRSSPTHAFSRGSEGVGR